MPLDDSRASVPFRSATGKGIAVMAGTGARGYAHAVRILREMVEDRG